MLEHRHNNPLPVMVVCEACGAENETFVGITNVQCSKCKKGFRTDHEVLLRVTSARPLDGGPPLQMMLEPEKELEPVHPKITLEEDTKLLTYEKTKADLIAFTKLRGTKEMALREWSDSHDPKLRWLHAVSVELDKPQAEDKRIEDGSPLHNATALFEQIREWRPAVELTRSTAHYVHHNESCCESAICNWSLAKCCGCDCSCCGRYVPAPLLTIERHFPKRRCGVTGVGCFPLNWVARADCCPVTFCAVPCHPCGVVVEKVFCCQLLCPLVVEETSYPPLQCSERGCFFARYSLPAFCGSYLSVNTALNSAFFHTKVSDLKALFQLKQDLYVYHHYQPQLEKFDARIERLKEMKSVTAAQLSDSVKVRANLLAALREYADQVSEFEERLDNLDEVYVSKYYWVCGLLQCSCCLFVPVA